MPGRNVLLEARGIVKRFGGLAANDHIDLTVRAGEIHALLGENGAGKSTLVKILYGSLQPDAGTVAWAGRQVAIGNPSEARALGIGMVFQHFSLFEGLTVAENIALALPPNAGRRGLAADVRSVSEAYGLPLDPAARVSGLPVGVRQRIEIVRCLLQRPRLIVMDEPTSVLTPQEAERLFETLRRLAGEGCAVLYISHRLEEIRQLCHAATVLRHGRVVGQPDPKTATAAQLARMMVGVDVEGEGGRRARRSRRGGTAAPVRLAVRGLSQSRGTAFGVALDDVSLEVRGGEILGVAGVAGNGQDELFAALSGEVPALDHAAIEIDGRACGRMGPAARRRLGAAFIPEERLGHAAVPEMRLSDNAVLTRHGTDPELVTGGLLRLSRARSLARRIVQRFDVRAPSGDPEARALSGGNLQKFVVGRELDRKPGVLAVSQPSWGVDIGAATEIRRGLAALADGGAAVLAISQDLDEILEISDRIAVISRGRLSPAVPASETTREAIGLLMGGAGD
ncbi:MAG: ABC transporter ATP-binding protein [Alphaproteobacteria bacterium]|nr:ABC transporter ATP-binding protein [Alphaproteobacteria bacterium]